MTRQIRVVDTRKNAEKTFHVFHDRPHTRAVEMKFGWPSRMQEVGEGEAELYRSNKWQKDLREHEDYKHVKEGSRTIYVRPGLLIPEFARDKLDVYGPMVQFAGPMPRHFTRLGELISIQAHLYDQDKSGKLFLPKDDRYYDIRVARGILGAAEHPETKETFLFVYDPNGVQMILTGGSLKVEKDGITG